MKRFLGSNASKEQSRGRRITAMRNLVEDREYPANPEPRIAPANRSEVQHKPGVPLQVTNMDARAGTFDLSVVPTSLAAHTIDKALVVAVQKMHAEAEERGEPYDIVAETAVMRFDGPAADIRREAKWARHEARPANPVLFRKHGVEMILTGLSELINQGEYQQALHADEPDAGRYDAMAVQTGKEAEDVLLTIGRQINAEAEQRPIDTEKYVGSVAVGAETVDLTDKVAALAVPVSVGKG
jgi:hypothetical protein